jgi:hypothetical protein
LLLLPPPSLTLMLLLCRMHALSLARWRPRSLAASAPAVSAVVVAAAAIVAIAVGAVIGAVVCAGTVVVSALVVNSAAATVAVISAAADAVAAAARTRVRMLSHWPGWCVSALCLAFVFGTSL